MNRTNLFLVLSLLCLCLLWFFRLRPVVEVKKELNSQVKVLEDEPQKLGVVTSEIKALKILKPPKKKHIKQPESQKISSKNFEIFKKKLNNEAFIKIIEDVALTGGDQIVGFIKSDQDFDEDGFYKTKVEDSLLWTDSIVPFGYAKGFPHELKDRVERAMAYFNQETGVRFVEFNESQDEDAVVFTFRPKLPCSSFVGRIGGLQQIFLNFDCGYQTVLHEIMHALGFVHEQQLPYRDNFVNILWENIEEDSLYNFTQVPEVWVKHYQGIGMDFDYQSVMIYSDKTFAQPGLKSMSSTTEALISPTSQGLSKIDLGRLSILY